MDVGLFSIHGSLSLKWSTKPFILVVYRLHATQLLSRHRLHGWLWHIIISLITCSLHSHQRATSYVLVQIWTLHRCLHQVASHPLRLHCVGKLALSQLGGVHSGSSIDTIRVHRFLPVHGWVSVRARHHGLSLAQAHSYRVLSASVQTLHQRMSLWHCARSSLSDG